MTDDGRIDGCFSIRAKPDTVAGVLEAFGFSKEELAGRMGTDAETLRKLEDRNSDAEPVPRKPS